MVHSPLVPPTTARWVTALSYCGYVTSLSQLIPVMYIGRRIIRSGETTGDDLLPHVVDWISAAFGVYIGLISPMTTKVAVLGLVASVIALATHSLFLIVYWRYSAPDDRITIAASFRISALITALAILFSWRYEKGSARVVVVTIIAAIFSYTSALLSFIGLVRAYRDPEHHIEIVTLADAWLATVNAGVLFGVGQLKGRFMHTHLGRLALGFWQIIGYTIIRHTRPRAREQEQERERERDMEMQMPPLQPPSPSPPSTPSLPPSPRVLQPPLPLGEEEQEQEQEQEREREGDIEMPLPPSPSPPSLPPSPRVLQPTLPLGEGEQEQERERERDIEMPPPSPSPPSLPPSPQVLQPPPPLGEEERERDMEMSPSTTLQPPSPEVPQPPPPLGEWDIELPSQLPSPEVLQPPPPLREGDIELPPLPLPSPSPPSPWVAQPPPPLMPTHLRQYMVACFLACYHVCFRILLE